MFRQSSIFSNSKVMVSEHGHTMFALFMSRFMNSHTMENHGHAWYYHGLVQALYSITRYMDNDYIISYLDYTWYLPIFYWYRHKPKYSVTSHYVSDLGIDLNVNHNIKISEKKSTAALLQISQTSSGFIVKSTFVKIHWWCIWCGHYKNYCNSSKLLT